MKKILALLLALVMLFCLTACGGDEAGTPTDENTGAITNTTESTNDPTDSAQGTTESSAGNTEQPATKPSGTEDASPARPSSNSSTTSFDTLVSKYSGRWYLDGYFDVYIDIFLKSDADHNRNDILEITANNFAIPDSESADGLIYPDLHNLDGYCSGFGIIRNDYDHSNLANYARYKLSFGESYIYIGSHKFVLTQGSIAISAGPSETKPDTSCLIFERQSSGYSVIGIASNAPSNMTIPNEYEGLPVISIGDAAGMNCTNLSSLTLPNSITRVDSCAFWGCSSLNSIIIPNSVTELGDCVFNQCTKLSSVTISNKVTVIADCLFSECSNLSKVNIPSGVTKIGLNAFAGCNILYSIALPSSLTKIENNAFEGSGLTTLTIPDRVNLGYCVFANCKKLTSVTIGKGISKIPDGTFTGCTSLTSITFTGTTAQWENISLGNDWNGSVPATMVTCSDGTISLTGNTEPTPSTPIPSEPQVVHVSGVQINNTALSLKVGDTLQLSATVYPSNADNKSVTWSSSNSSVAQVSSTGKITAKGAGSATITVTTVDGNYTATCAVTVTAPSSPEPVSDVLIISNTQTISNQTIDTDVYITSTGVATFNNVTVNGNIYCYGQLKCSGCTANNVYAYAYGSMMSCGAFDGTHGKVSGGISCNNMTILDNALDYAFSKWGKK